MGYYAIETSKFLRILKKYALFRLLASEEKGSRILQNVATYEGGLIST